MGAWLGGGIWLGGALLCSCLIPRKCSSSKKVETKEAGV